MSAADVASTNGTTALSAANNLTLTSGKDMDIIGSKAQGEKITAKVGGNLNIETLQEKENYEEQNKSAGFGVSWGVKAKEKATSTKSTGQTQNPPTTNATKSTPKPNNTKVPAPTTGRKFFAPTIGASWNKGNIDSHYRSAREQAGFFAGSGGFDIYVEKNTNLKGGVIASETSPDKNRLSTGTLTFSDLKNEADYSAKSIGASYHKYGNFENMSEDEQNKVYNTKGLAPNLSMPVKGDASSTTKAAVAAGTIDIRENPTQDISALSRDTQSSLNELGRIFDKKTIEEQQELAAVFGEEAFRLLHNMKDDGSGRKIAAHAIIGGLMSQITGAGFASGAIGAGLNEAVINSLKGLDPGLAQTISGLLGAAAAKVAGGNALAGASAAISGTKWNHLGKDKNTRPIRVGIGVETDGTGHVSFIVENEDGSYEEANYGRYGAKHVPSIGAWPNGIGRYLIDNDFDPYHSTRKIYFFNPNIIDPNNAVYAYNHAIFDGGYEYREVSPSNQMLIERNRSVKYYYELPSGVSDYRLLSHNCVTTSIAPMIYGYLGAPPKINETLYLLSTYIAPDQIAFRVNADWVLNHGKGLVEEVIE